MASEGGVEKEGMSEYVSHHLTHLKSQEQHSLVDFSVVHWDTVFFSLLCAALLLIVLRLSAVRATARAGSDGQHARPRRAADHPRPRQERVTFARSAGPAGRRYVPKNAKLAAERYLVGCGHAWRGGWLRILLQ